MTSPPRLRLAYAAWLTVCIVWGTTYLGILISLETVPPMLMGGIRWTCAGSIFALAVAMRGGRLPPREHWTSLAVMGFLFIGLGNGGVVWAEQWLPSGLTALIVATAPFWMIGVEALWPDGERVTTRRIVGLLIGFLGVTLLVWPDLRVGGDEGSRFLHGVLALQLAAAGWSVGSSYSRRHTQKRDPFGSAALQMLFGGLIMLCAGTIRGEWGLLSFSRRSAAALAYLTTFGSIGGFGAYIYALKHLPVSTVLLYAYVNPVIAVIVGILVLGEPFDLHMLLAAAIVLVGVAIVRS